MGGRAARRMLGLGRRQSPFAQAMSGTPLALSTIPLPAPPAGTDYEAICATVMATARGRRFLEQYASRTRNSDTRLLLNAIERIESAVRDERSRQADLELRSDLLEMAKTIAQTRAEVTKPEAFGCGKHPAEPPAPEAIFAVDARAVKPRSAVASPAMPAELDPAADVEPADFLLEPLPDLDSADRPLPRVANFSRPPPEPSPPLPSEV